MSLQRTLLLVALALPGCFIGGVGYQNAVCKLDEDGDGDPKCGTSNTTADGDCDDDNPAMSNLRDETGAYDDEGNVVGGAYDGFDNDCEGGDLLDVDDDQYPGISREDYEALGEDPWPSGLNEAVDCLDLHPTPQEEAFGVDYPAGIEGDVNPSVNETWYNGLDNDCDGDNDFDQDGDGVATTDVPEWFDAYIAFYGLPPMDATDCNDTEADVRPGTTVPETWYDGQDQDCAGDNDFDPDGDGYLTPGYDADARSYVEQFGYEEQPWAEAGWVDGGDCLDLYDTFDGVEVDAARAAATQRRLPTDGLCPDGSTPTPDESCEDRSGTFYDGYDNACDDVIDGRVVHNEFDADGDGYMPSGQREAFIAYVQRYRAFTNSLGEQPYRAPFTSAYGGTDEAIGTYYDQFANDCDDADPAINPTAVERLGDASDQDCDGLVDGTRFQHGSLTWYDPGPPRLTRTDDHFVLVSAATSGIDAADGFGIRKRRLVALSWPRGTGETTTAQIDAAPFSVANPDRNLLHPQVGLAGDGASYFVGASWSAPRTRLQVVKMDRDFITAANYLIRKQSFYDGRTIETEYSQADLRCDTTVCWQIACDGTSVHFVQFDRSNTLTDRILDFDDTVNAQDCFVVPASSNDGTLLLGTVDGTGAVSAWEQSLGVLATAAVNPFDTLAVDWARGHDDWLLLGEATGGIRAWATPTDATLLLSGDVWRDGDAVAVGEGAGRTWYVAGLRDDGTVVFAHGTAGSLTEVVLPVEAPGGTVTPSAVSIEADEGRVILSVAGVDAGGTDTVGWAIIDVP